MPAFRPADLAYEMEVRGLTDSDISRLTGLARATVAGARQGREVSVRTASRLLEALQLRPRLPGSELLAQRSRGVLPGAVP
jgi:transcriptional regulator with XRE-family HTH domain